MNRVLFIIPAFQTGGTISSLNSIFSKYKEKCDISVFAISHVGSASMVFDASVLPEDKFLSLYYGSIASHQGWQYLGAVLVKLIRRFNILLGGALDSMILKLAATRIEKKNNFDVIVGFQEGQANHLASLFHVSHKVAWIHCNYKYYSGCGKEEKVYSRFDEVICVSRFTRSEFCDVYPDLSSRVTSIYNLCDEGRVLELSRHQICDSRFQSDMISLVSIGRLVPVKRFNRIPIIASQLKARGIAFRWYILGEGKEDVLMDIVDGVEQNKLQEVVVLLGNKDNPYPYIAAADLYVCLSESEACPMTFIEASILNTPIISTDFGSAREFVCDGINGAICSIDGMADKIEEFIKKMEFYGQEQRSNKNSITQNDEILMQLNRILL